MATEAAAASTAAASEPTPDAAGPVEERAADGIDPLTPPLHFGVLLLGASLGALHELWVTQPTLYLAAGGGDRWTPMLAGLGAAAFCILTLGRRPAGAFARLPWLLCLAALSCAASGPALFSAFGAGGRADRVAALSAVAAGLAFGAVWASAWHALGRTLLRLGALERVLHPYRLLALALGFGVAAGAASMIGTLRSTTLVAMVLAALAAWCGPLHWFLERRRLPVDRAARAAGWLLFAACLGLFATHEGRVPLEGLGRYANPVVFAVETREQSLAVTSGQDALELWVDGRLEASTVTEQRYHQALAQPALTLAPRRARVLVLGGGTGLLEREALRHPDVEQVTTVVLERALPELARRQRWLRERAGNALDSPRVRWVEGEPLLFLEQDGGTYDVALVDLPDPTDFSAGKHYTTFFFRALRARLAPQGVIAVQALSASASPRALAAVSTTLAAAGFDARAYHAPIPTLGDWGFVLGLGKEQANVPDFAQAGRFLSGATSSELGYLPADLRAAGELAPSTLHDQVVVDLVRSDPGR